MFKSHTIILEALSIVVYIVIELLPNIDISNYFSLFNTNKFKPPKCFDT